MNGTIDIRIKGRYGSISDLEWLNVPPFAVLTGVNGTGKSQLLEIIAKTYGAWRPRNPHEPTVVDHLQGAHAVIDGLSLDQGEVFHTYDEWIQQSPSAAGERQIRETIESLHLQLRGRTGSSQTRIDAGVPWLLEQLDITVEDARELSIEELFEHLTPGLLYGLMSRAGSGSMAFLFLAYRLFEREALARNISEREVQRRYGEPPWVLLNEILDASGLPFRVLYPDPIRPSSLFYETSFALRLRDVERSVEVPFEGLSSGEKVIMSTVLWRYDAQQLGRHPRFLLLDEPDAHLHPSLTRRFLDVVQKVFVEERGVRVIMTTHSPSTVSLTPEESLFEMRRTHPRIQPAASKARAVAILTDGFVTVQEATQTILLEGKDDPPFYEQVWDLLTERTGISEPGPLEPFPGVAFIYGKGKDTVEQIVPQMRSRGLWSFHGIIDRDLVASSQ